MADPRITVKRTVRQTEEKKDLGKSRLQVNSEKSMKSKTYCSRISNEQLRLPKFAVWRSYLEFLKIKTKNVV